MTGRSSILWTVASLVSVGLHVGLVSALLAFHNAGQAGKTAVPAPVESTPASPAPVESTPVEAMPTEAKPVDAVPVATNPDEAAAAKSKDVSKSGQGTLPANEVPFSRGGDAPVPAKAKPVADHRKDNSRGGDAPVPAKTKTKSRPQAPASRVPGGIYVVKAGDSLTKIAQAHGISPEELARMNGTTVKKLNTLYVGRRLKVPAVTAEKP